jgi:2-polyprenyl-3-methyl-5-hydroxy-6-metoxy-1,4-benzoquinol methylase
MIELINPNNGKKLIKRECGYADDAGNTFLEVNNVIRFVKDDNYTENFGFQWNKFAQTQIDNQKNPISRIRFFAETEWEKIDLSGKNVLEVGSGAGRFSSVVLKDTKANLYTLDYSNAVEANYKNNSQHGNRFNLFQASIYEMPFIAGQFDKVFCLGVLQHTPDFKKSVKCLVDQVKTGGELVVDFYPIRGWWTKIQAKYILRPITKKMSHEKLLQKIDRNANWMIKVSNFFDRIGMGRIVNRFIPVCDIKGTLPKNLTKQELWEWVVLDTFDMFSPQYDNPQKLETVRNWFIEFGMEVTFAGTVTYGDNFRAVVVRGIKK